jgi:hypothetical protein
MKALRLFTSAYLKYIKNSNDLCKTDPGNECRDVNNFALVSGKDVDNKLPFGIYGSVDCKSGIRR